MVHVLTLGIFAIQPDHENLPVRLGREASDFAAFLFTHPHKLLRRERLLDMFWGELSEGRARKAMSHALWQLRARIEAANQPKGDKRIESDHTHVVLTLGDEDFIDCRAFSQGITEALDLACEDRAMAQLDQALRLYKGEFLEHLSDAWAVEIRERLQALYVRGMTCKIAAFARRCQYDEAIECSRSVLAVDPIRETMQRNLMRLHVLSGNRAHAICAFQSCADMLRRDYGIDPMPETIALYQRIRSGDVFGSIEDERRHLIG